MIGKEMSCAYTGGLREGTSQCPQTEVAYYFRTRE